MSNYKTIVNPTTGELQLVFDGTIVAIKSGVATYNSLPVIGNAKGDARIANDTGHMYIWLLESDSGSLSDWDDQGDIIDITWDAISGRPNATVINIDDAVSKKHTQGTDTTLGAMTDDLDMNNHSITNVKDDSIGFQSGGSINRADYLDSVSKKHTQNTDTKLNNGGVNQVSASEIVKNIYNTILLAFKLAIQESLTFFNMIDVIVDEYEDESGIDTINSINQTYYSSDDYYSSESIIDSDTKLLCHFNGDDGATDTEDSSPSGHTFTFNNNAQLDIDNYKFGGSALKLGATDTINILDSTEDWQFGTDDFTIEFWFYPTQNYGGGQVNIMANDVWWIFWHSGGFGLYMDDGHLVYAPNNALTVNEWNHVAICKYSGTMYIYVDGIDVTNSRIGTINVAGTNNIYIGNTNASYSVYGWIDELRISKGIARYTSNFTPQSSEFRGEIKNITLISDNFVADSVPSSTRIIVFEEDVDVITLNTDLKTYITRDDGTHWEEVILSAKVDYDTNKRVLIGTADLSEQDSDTNMRYKHVTANTKNLKIHGTSLLWD